jgi:hypothetical protein
MKYELDTYCLHPVVYYYTVLLYDRQHNKFIIKTTLLYKVRQFNSRNGPVKAKFAYLCTRGCCRLRNTLLVKLCNS